MRSSMFFAVVMFCAVTTGGTRAEENEAGLAVAGLTTQYGGLTVSDAPSGLRAVLSISPLPSASSTAPSGVEMRIGPGRSARFPELAPAEEIAAHLLGMISLRIEADANTDGVLDAADQVALRR